MGGGQALALQQVGDDARHLAQVAQQRLARRLGLGGVGQQLGVEARARQRTAQFVAQGQQQGALGLQHLVDVFTHGVDGGGQLPQLVGLVCVAHGDGLVERAGAKALGASADVVQRAQQAPHVEVGQRREQQQHAQRDPGDARALLPAQHVQAEFQPVAVGRGAAQQVLVVAIAPGRLAPGGAVHPCGPGQLGVRGPVHLRPFNADGDGQALHQGLGAHDARRAADLLRQAVHVVHEQRPRGRAPAHRQRLLHAADEGDRQRQRQHQEHQHQAPAQRAPQRQARALVPGAVRVVVATGLHPATRRSASE